ncbi:MAG: hypothetical protein P8P83_01160 [Rickettsiaceae bacterium]|nr:hypothetical protein [Rickettsiaceae bacterium]
MISKKIFQHFISGFLSVFSFGKTPVKPNKSLDIAEYFCKIENDINKSYQELKDNERN